MRWLNCVLIGLVLVLSWRLWDLSRMIEAEFGTLAEHHADTVESMLGLVDEERARREACMSMDPAGHLTAERYLDYLDHGWICDVEGAGCGSCSRDAMFDSMMRDICALGWQQASDEWAYWESEARRCQCRLDLAAGKRFSRFEPRAWGGCW